jgi:hypothetical protein
MDEKRERTQADKTVKKEKPDNQFPLAREIVIAVAHEM